VSDETPTREEPEDRQSGEQAETPVRPAIDVSQLPSLPTHPRSQQMPGTNIGRWATFGCVALMLILVVLLVIGVNLTKRTVWMAYARAQQRVIEALPRGLPSGEQMRTDRNLQRFRARLDMTAEPMPLMGQFLAQVTTALEDDELSTEEIEGLNGFMEEVLDGTGTLDP
jgi:hypothetical protein